MVSHGRELSSIDFESMLGGPLSAVVNAQDNVFGAVRGPLWNLGKVFAMNVCYLVADWDH